MCLPTGGWLREASSFQRFASVGVAPFLLFALLCGFRGHRAQHSDLKARGIPK